MTQAAFVSSSSERRWLPHAAPAPLSGTVAGTSRRTVVIAGADEELRRPLCLRLTDMRWNVRNAPGGAAAMAFLDEVRTEALLLIGVLPDLEVEEFAERVGALHPETDLLRLDGTPLGTNTQSPQRNELLQVLRELGETVAGSESNLSGKGERGRIATPGASGRPGVETPVASMPDADTRLSGLGPIKDPVQTSDFLPEMVGTSGVMRELGRLVRLVAPRSTSVLIEGDTGTGKELVAKALHRLSSRANKPFLVLNCAAIPEALLEAELFGHTRGAFTGAVRSRIGRIEAADGGTMFLDEIGEMPLALQSKMLRFLECGELQRVGENDPSYVDVRIIAATHQPLEQRAEEQTFRLDLYHRLSVFPIDVPSLASRMVDLPLLAEHFLRLYGRGNGPIRISDGAMEMLQAHHWPGNVRELMHVLERALILAGPTDVLDVDHIRLRKRDRSIVVPL